MSNNKQSSVDWLINHITHDQMVKSKSLYEWLEIFEQAKAMHKEEMKESYSQGRTDQQSSSDSFYNRNAEQYYNETFAADNE